MTGGPRRLHGRSPALGDGRPPSLPNPAGAEAGRGTLLGLAAYAIWGLFPLYFHALAPSGPWEILAHRILWTLVFCALVLLSQRDFAWLGPLMRRPRTVAGITLAAVLIATNWVVYVTAVLSGHVSDAALGYFLNPLVTVALGVVVLRERMRRLQWVAVGIGLVAGAYLWAVGGKVPVVALTLALSFALYGLTKKKLGATLPALHGLTIETIVLVPVAVVALLLVGRAGDLTFGAQGAVHTALLVGSGVATAVPLLFFAAAARRIPLVTIGLIQFITPVMQLLVGVLLLGEVMSTERWVGFAIVWLALIVLTADSIMSLRRRPRGPVESPAGA